MRLLAVVILALMGVVACTWAAAPPAPLTAAQLERLAAREALEKNPPFDRDKAILLWREALAKDREVFGENSLWLNPPRLKLAAQLEFVAVNFERGKKWDKAVAPREQAAELKAQVYGSDNWRSIDARLALSHARQMSGLTEEQHSQLSASQKRSSALGQTSPKKDSEVGNLSKELKVTRSILGEKSRRTFWLTIDLADEHLKANDFRNAEQCLTEAVTLAKTVYGERHPGYAFALQRSGVFLAQKGVLRAAENQLRRAVALYAELLQHDDLETLAAAQVLGRVCGQREKFDEGERLLRGVLDQLHRFAQSASARQETLRGLIDPWYSANRAQTNEDWRWIVASVHNDLATLFAKKGDSARALASLRAQVPLLNDIGRTDKYYPSGRQAYQRTLELCKDGLPQSDWRVTDARVALGRLDRIAGDDKPGPTSLGAMIWTAEGHDKKAEDAYRKGDYREAMLEARMSLQFRLSALGADHPDVALSLNNLGMACRALGETDEALAHLSAAYRIRRKALGERHPETALCLNNLGQVHIDRSEVRLADGCLRRSLEIFGEALDRRHGANIDGLNNLGVLHQRLGDHTRAEKYFLEALNLHQLAVNSPPLERSLRDREVEGLRHALVVETNWAATLYATGMSITGSFVGGTAGSAPVNKNPFAIQDAARRAAYLGNLGRSRMTLGRTEDAKKSLREALAIYDKAVSSAGKNTPPFPGESNDHAAALNSLALLLVQQKEFREANELLERALAIRKKLRGEKSAFYAVGLDSLAALADAEGDRERATKLLRQALAITRVMPGESSVEFAAASSNLAYVLHGAGKTDEALAHARRATVASMASLHRLACIQTDNQQIARLNAFRGHLDHYFSLTAVGEKPEEAYEVVLAWKGVVFVRQQQLRERRTLAGRPDASGLRHELDDVTRRMAQLALASGDEGKDLPRLEKHREELERQLAEKAPEVRDRMTGQQLTPKQLCQSLPADVVLVDYLEYNHTSFGKKGREVERRLAAFVVRREGVERFDLGPAAAVREAVASWREVLGRKRLDREDPAVTLRKLVWDPLAKPLKGAKTVVTSPDGALAWLPFAALPGEKERSYLIEDVALASVAVPQALPALLGKKQATKGESSLLVVGDVDYDGLEGGKVRSGDGGKWDRLAGTRAEMLSVRDSFETRFNDGDTRTLRGAKATESSFRRHAPEHRFIHVATHGFFAPAKDQAETHPGLLSGIVVSGANKEPGPDEDDGVLTALEVAEMDLTACELAVLSACETGLGKEAGGEGLLGLQRALQVAGCKSVVASLWKVDDKATQEMMTAFYRAYWDEKKPLSRAEALRQAQLTMLREGGKRGMVRRETAADKDAPVPPFYWAAFVLSGDWR